jgi:hypothetical protein
MKLNKVFIEDEVALDLTQDTVTEEDVAEGKTFHKADGSEAVGTAVISEPTPTQEKTVTIDANKTVEVLPDDGYALSKVTANVSVPIGGDGLFSKFIMGQLSVVTIPGDVTSIGSYVFYGIHLQQIHLHSGIVGLGRYAIGMNDFITTLDIPESVYSMNQYAVTSCANLREITVRGKLTDVSNNVFASNRSLKKVTFLADGCRVGDNMFYYDQQLTEVITPNGIALANEIFNGCSALESIVISDSQLIIPKRAFASCTSLKNVTLPSNLTTIKEYAFAYCGAFDIGEIPSTVTTIENYAFYMSGAKNVVIPSSVTSPGQSIFTSCSSLTSLVYNSDAAIPYALCSSCAALETVQVNGNITEIETSVFTGCSKLREVTLPATVTTIGDYAFYQCNDTKFTILAETPPTIGSRTFYTTTGGMTIYVPADSVDAYKSATNWSAFASYIQPIAE